MLFPVGAQKRFLLVFLFLAAPRAASSQEFELPSSPDNSGYWQPLALYGKDDRAEIYDAPARWQELARSAPALFDKSKITFDGNNAVLSDKYRYGDGSYQTLPPEVRFYLQPQPAFCSAFLVAPDLILTAGHCIKGTFGHSCESLSIVFDYLYAAPGREPTKLPRSSIFACRELVDYRVENTLETAAEPLRDWALLRLDRPAAGRTPLSISSKPPPAIGSPVAMIGYPVGMPAKLATGKLRRVRPNGSLETNLDSFGSNSGSPVFDLLSREVIGLISEGVDDFVTPKRRPGAPPPRTRLNIWGDEGGPGEAATPASAFLPEIQKYLRN